MATPPRATGRGSAKGPRPRNRDITAAVGQLGFARQLTGIDFDFEPSIGILARNIDKLSTDIRSFREPLTRAVKEVMIPSFRRNFDAQGRPEPWAPLAPYTVQVRKSTGPILVRSGRLRKVATSFSIWEISQNGAVITSLGSKAWYGALMQGGTSGFGVHIEAAKKELGSGARPGAINRRAFEIMDEKGGDRTAMAAIPARPFIMFQEEDEEAIQEIFWDWLNNRVDLYWGASI
jgi:phage gpG-like protein